MATQKEYNPFNEEDTEEKDRLYSKDEFHDYKLPENVPDESLLPDQFEEKEKIPEGTVYAIDELEDEDFHDNEPTREEQIEQLKKEIKFGSLFGKEKLAKIKKEPQEKPLGYIRGDGVASIGPDMIEHQNGSEIEVDHTTPIDPTLMSEKEISEDNKGSREKVSSLTAEKNAYARHHRDHPKREENLKTESASKKERRSRSWLSKLFSGQWKTKEMEKEELRDQMHEEFGELFETPDDPFEYHEENKDPLKDHYDSSAEYVDEVRKPDDLEKAA